MFRTNGVRLRRQASNPESSNTMRGWRVIALLVLAAVVVLVGIYWPRPQPKAVSKAFAIGWRPVVSWSGHGDSQTESFNIETGQWRIKWATKPQAQGEPVSSNGNFRVAVHSLVSGRFVSVVAERQGAGSGIAYMAEEPRQFFLVIESAGLNWMVQVEEGVVGEEENPR
jgi:hypothetical protein